MPSNDPLGPLWPGDRPPNSARAFNRFREAARAQQSSQLGNAPPPGPRESNLEPANHVFIVAGADGLPQFSVSTYGTPAIPPDAQTAPEVRRRPVFAAGVPASDTDEVCVTVAAAGPGGQVAAVCAGVAVCKLLITDATHTRAVPITGDSTKLASAATDGYPVVFKEGGTGEKWAAVLLAMNAGGASGGDAAPPAAGACLRAFRGWRNTDCVEVNVLNGTGDCANIVAQTMGGLMVSGVWVGEETIPTPLGPATFSVAAGTNHPEGKLTIPVDSGPAIEITGTYIGCKGRSLEFDFSDPQLCAFTPVTDCGACPAGAPRLWSIPFAGGNGDFTSFNQTFSVSHDAGCVWQVTSEGVTCRVTRGETGYTVDLYDGEDLEHSRVWVTYAIELDAEDCCGPYTMDRVDYGSETGAPAGTVTATGAACPVPCGENSLVIRIGCGTCDVLIECGEDSFTLPRRICMAIDDFQLSSSVATDVVVSGSGSIVYRARPPILPGYFTCIPAIGCVSETEECYYRGDTTAQPGWYGDFNGVVTSSGDDDWPVGTVVYMQGVLLFSGCSPYVMFAIDTCVWSGAFLDTPVDFPVALTGIVGVYRGIGCCFGGDSYTAGTVTLSSSIACADGGGSPGEPPPPPPGPPPPPPPPPAGCCDGAGEILEPPADPLGSTFNITGATLTYSTIGGIWEGSNPGFAYYVIACSSGVWTLIEYPAGGGSTSYPGTPNCTTGTINFTAFTATFSA